MAGMQSAQIAGDPQKPGEEFTLWLKMKAGFRMAPHWHPVDENLTVLSGEFTVGMGETMVRLAPGDFVQIPAKLPHYGVAKSDTIVQIHGKGPLITYWVTPHK